MFLVSLIRDGFEAYDCLMHVLCGFHHFLPAVMGEKNDAALAFQGHLVICTEGLNCFLI